MGIIGAFVVLIIPFVLGFQNHNHSLDKEQSLCPLKMLTGFPCPSCGITKSIVYLYEGDILTSLSYHLLGPIVVFFALFIIILFSIEIKTKQTYFRAWFLNKKFAYTLGAFLMVYHTIRLVLFIQENSWDSIVEQSIWK